MSYESDCNDFAVFGDAMREHYDYEDNAEYDRWDGHRADADWEPDPGCPVCGYRSDCTACVAAAAASIEKMGRELETACDEYVPF